jgi:hypothetical protein
LFKNLEKLANAIFANLNIVLILKNQGMKQESKTGDSVALFLYQSSLIFVQNFTHQPRFYQQVG